MEPKGQGRVERRLAAILAADVAGYSRLIEATRRGRSNASNDFRSTGGSGDAAAGSPPIIHLT